MDKLFLRGKMADCSPEEVLVYCYLRSDIINSNTEAVREYKHKSMLVSGSAVQTIAQALGLTEVAVKQGIDGLCRKEWIKQLKESGTVYQLGKIVDYESKWMITSSTLSKKHAGVKSKILRMVREKKERERSKRVVISAELKRGIARGITKGEFRDIPVSTTLIDEFMKGFLAVVGSAYDGRKTLPRDRMYMNKFNGFCNNDVDGAVDLMRFVFSNWKAIKATTGLMGVPTTGIFATATIIKRFKTFKEFGVPTTSIEGSGVGKRFDKTLSETEPEEGFI